MDDRRFQGFKRLDVDYKTVNGQGIGCTIWSPKNTPSKAVPVIARWHGGGLVAGVRDEEPIFPPWIIALADLHSAVILSFDYRLLPEAKGIEILTDIQDAMRWLHTTFSSVIQQNSPEIVVDLTCILITGESAGGYCAIQTLLNWDASFARPRAVIAHYPLIDLHDPHYSVAGRKHLFGTTDSLSIDQANGTIDLYLKNMRPGQVRSRSAWDPLMQQLIEALFVSGRYPEVVGSDVLCYPVEMLSRVHPSRLVPLWIFHGIDDVLVPAKGTARFYGRAKELQLLDNWDLLVTYIQGQQHAFDINEGSLQMPWVKEGVMFLSRYWP